MSCLLCCIAGMYGGSDWSFEVWAYQTSYLAENPIIQW